VKNLAQALNQRLKGAKRLSLLGVGSDLRGDDVAGILVANSLSLKAKKSRNFKVFIGETAPENLTGEIRKFDSTHLIIVDSADMNKKPGSVQLIDPDQIGGLSFCTHSLPLKVMTDYLEKSVGCKTCIIGIQPKGLGFDTRCSPEVRRTAKNISNLLWKVVKNLGL
jgi:hydrogenase 3 maturation protease